MVDAMKDAMVYIMIDVMVDAMIDAMVGAMVDACYHSLKGPPTFFLGGGRSSSQWSRLLRTAVLHTLV